MKRVFTVFVVAALLFAVVAPVALVQAQAGTDADKLPVPTKIPSTTGPTTGNAVLNQVGVIGNWLFAIFLAIAVIFIVWGAIQFVTGGGDPAKVTEARQKMIYAAIGIGFALLAGFFDDILGSLLNIT